jgi:hypothetical protein
MSGEHDGHWTVGVQGIVAIDPDWAAATKYCFVPPPSPPKVVGLGMGDDFEKVRPHLEELLAQIMGPVDRIMSILPQWTRVS